MSVQITIPILDWFEGRRQYQKNCFLSGITLYSVICAQCSFRSPKKRTKLPKLEGGLDDLGNARKNNVFLFWFLLLVVRLYKMFHSKKVKFTLLDDPGWPKNKFMPSDLLSPADTRDWVKKKNTKKISQEIVKKNYMTSSLILIMCKRGHAKSSRVCGEARTL